MFSQVPFERSDDSIRLPVGVAIASNNTSSIPQGDLAYRRVSVPAYSRALWRLHRGPRVLVTGKAESTGPAAHRCPECGSAEVVCAEPHGLFERFLRALGLRVDDANAGGGSTIDPRNTPHKGARDKGTVDHGRYGWSEVTLAWRRSIR
jgi:hypothetical protein